MSWRWGLIKGWGLINDGLGVGVLKQCLCDGGEVAMLMYGNGTGEVLVQDWDRVSPQCVVRNYGSSSYIAIDPGREYH